VAQTKTNLAGYTQSFGAGLLDFMVVKTDTGGNVPTCPVGNPIPTEISQYMVVSALSLGSNQSNDHNGGLSNKLHFRRLLFE